MRQQEIKPPLCSLCISATKTLSPYRSSVFSTKNSSSSSKQSKKNKKGEVGFVLSFKRLHGSYRKEWDGEKWNWCLLLLLSFGLLHCIWIVPIITILIMVREKEMVGFSEFQNQVGLLTCKLLVAGFRNRGPCVSQGSSPLDSPHPPLSLSL